LLPTKYIHTYIISYTYKTYRGHGNKQIFGRRVKARDHYGTLAVDGRTYQKNHKRNIRGCRTN